MGVRTSRCIIVLLPSVMCIYTCCLLSRPSVSGEDAPVTRRIRKPPLTVAMHVADPSFIFNKSAGMPWELSVNSSGQAVATVWTLPTPLISEFVVPKEDFQEIYEMFSDDRFFSMQPSYGMNVPEGYEICITAVIGEQSKSVKLLYVDRNYVRMSKDKAKLAVFARIASMLHNTIKVNNIADLTQVFEMIVAESKK